MNVPDRVELFAVRWPEVLPGDDLCQLTLESTALRDGDVMALTSKVVSKAEGRGVSADRGEIIDAESVRVLARRGDALIAETRLGLVMAAAGVDASNAPAGTVLRLPVDPDGSARSLRERLHAATGVNVAVVISDTAGRAWRMGQTDMAVGCAGIAALVDLQGSTDAQGQLLSVTAPAVADELASAADLVKGKATGRPLAVIRGVGGQVLRVGDHGPGAAALIRRREDDLFGLGAREAATAAGLRDDAVALAHFPAFSGADSPPFTGLTSTHENVAATVTSSAATPKTAAEWVVRVDVHRDADEHAWLHAGALLERARTLASAHRLREAEPTRQGRPDTGWRTVGCLGFVLA